MLRETVHCPHLYYWQKPLKEGEGHNLFPWIIYLPEHTIFRGKGLQGPSTAYLLFLTNCH